MAFLAEAKKYEELITEIEDEIYGNEKYLSEFTLSVITDKIESFRIEQNKPIEFAKEVCKCSGCTWEDISVHNRVTEIIRARQIIVVGFVHIFGMSYFDAAEIIKHSRCLYHGSIQSVHNWYDTDLKYREMFKPIFENYPQILNYTKL